MTEENYADVDVDVSGKALTSWKNAPTVRDLKQDYTDAQSDHSSQSSKIEAWLDQLHVRGSAAIPKIKNRSSVQPQLIRKQAEWRYAALSEPFLDTDELFSVKPVTWEDKQAAKQNQLVLNNQMNTKINKVRFIDDYVRAAVDEGTVIVRVNWLHEEEDVTETVPIIELTENPDMVEILEQASQLKAENPYEFEQQVPEELQQALQASEEDGVPYEGTITGYEEVETTKTVKNQPDLEVCHYGNVIIDPTCMGQIEQAQFVIYKFETSLAELERDGKYENLEHINVRTNSILSEPDNGPDNTSNFNFSDKPRQKFTVYEYWGTWDIHGNGTVEPIVASWVGDVLIRLEENPYPDKRPPFVTVPYLPVRRSVYGEPDGELLGDNQRIIGAVTRGMIDIMGNSANGQTGVRRDALDPTNRRRFLAGQDYEFNGQSDPRNLFFTHQYPEIPASAQFMVQSQNLEAESMTGIKAFTGGLSGDSLGNTATGVRGALDAASKRELNILRRLSQGMVDIGRKIIAMNAAFLTDTEIVRFTNEEFVEIRRDDLPGNFDLSLSIATAEADNAKAQELAFMLQTMGNNMDPQLSKMILTDIARLRKMPALAKQIESYEPQPDPMQQRIQELELAKLEAEIEEIKSKTQKNMADAGEKEATTDQKSLDFIEQESGVKQERDIQRIGEQARSQADLKRLDIEAKREGGAEKARDDALRDYINNSAN